MSSRCIKGRTEDREHHVTTMHELCYVHALSIAIYNAYGICHKRMLAHFVKE